MKRWKQYLSLMTAAAMVISGPVIPAKQAKAADAQMVTDTDLSDTEVAEPASWGATPNAEQLWYMKQGTAAFCHFGPNTFNNVEWGENYGETAPVNLFTLTKDFDAESLVKAVKEAGFSRLILTAKHHDGFCLWSSEYTDYDIASTNYKNGKGDILEEISDACTKYNLDMGCYLSPWDIHEDKYGCFGDNNNKKNNNNTGTFTDYNELYVAWINEICTATKKDENGKDLLDEKGEKIYKYGNNNPNHRSDRFVEWWMDGAQGSESNRQTYDWKAILSAIRKNNPSCQVFGTGKAVNGKNGAEDKALAGTGGIHWIGNESGWASNETWAKINIGEDYEKLPKSDGAYIGVSEGAQWSVPEVDTKMLAGWFWRDSAGDSTTKSEKELANIYFRTVGRGATLLMNLSPNKEGKVGETQLNRFKEFGSNIQETFDEDFTKEEGVTASATSVWGNSKKFSASKVIDTIPKGKTYDETYWAPADGETTGSLEINLNGIKKFDVVSIEEYIQKGQTISSFTVEYKDVTGRWHDFGKGATISAKRLCRSEAVEGTAVRINITGAKATPKICNVGVYKAAKGFEVESSGTTVLPTNLKRIGISEATREGNWTFEADEDGVAQGSAWGNAGVTASFKFTGTKAWVIGTADPNHGNMDVYIDGIKVDTVSTKQTPRKMGALLYTTKELAYGEHTIKLVGASQALGISKIWYADGSGIFSMKQKECDLLYGGKYDVEITRTAGSHGKVTVGYSTQSAGAEQGVNYVNLTGTVTFEDGQTSKTITLTGLENDRSADGKDFYFTLMQAENSEASFNTDSYTHVTLYHPNVDKIMERAEEINLADYEAASANAFQSAVSTLKDLLFDEKATDEQKKTAMNNLVKAKNELVSTGSTGMVLPAAGEETEVEAEGFTLNPLNGDSTNHVHVEERSEASGGKVVDWFMNGDTISMNFYAPAAGQYKVTATYQSGRTEAGGNPNVFSWKGTNVESGSLDVYGEAGATQVHTAEFTINVTQKGHGTLVFEGTEKEGPRIDKFVFSKASEEATGIQINKQKMSLSKKDQTERIYVKVNPEDSANQNVTFTTSDDKVATVDEKGNVKAVANGTAVITVSTKDGKHSASCEVTVFIEQQIIDELVADINKELNSLKDQKESDYTADSWKAFDAARKAAETAAADKNVTKADLETALANLKAAVSKLVKKPAENNKQPETPSASDNKTSTDTKLPAAGTTKTVGKAVYKVIKSDAKAGTAALVKLNNKNEKKFTVPATVKIDGVTFKVTEISKNAFRNNKKLRQVTIGKNVTKIGANAFSGDKSLKKITIKSKFLKKVGKNAFKGIHKNCKIKVPAKKLASYKKLLNKKGQKASVKITK